MSSQPPQAEPAEKDPRGEQPEGEVEGEQPKKNNRKLLLFILLALLGILLGFLIFSLAKREKRVPPPPRPPQPRRPPPPKKDHCSNYNAYKDEAFGKFNVYVADFQELHESCEFEHTVGAELTQNGFSYKITDDEEDFVAEAAAYDIIWIFSANEFDDDEDYQCYLRALDQLMAARKPLYIWADNSPYTVHANIIFERYFEGMKVSGNYRGTELITGTKGQLTAGKFNAGHFLGCYLENIYEGNTICTTQNLHPDFQVFAYNSNYEPVILFAEENENHGRIVVDCGFTKIYRSFWDLAENAQYTANANLWLTGIPN